LQVKKTKKGWLKATLLYFQPKIIRSIFRVVPHAAIAAPRIMKTQVIVGAISIAHGALAPHLGI
jgi:hypothetical protein